MISLQLASPRANRVLLLRPWADLEAVYLRGADLAGADLRAAHLAGAYLAHADLAGAILAGCDLAGACLTGANLVGANLTAANLAGANLEGANLKGTNLEGSCLDPAAPVPPITDADILAAGLEITGEYVIGWRTRTSRYVGVCEYIPGQTYEALVFSVSSTSCHPGLYLAGREWLARMYPDAEIVHVRSRRCDLHHVGDKWRTRRLEVLG